MNKFQQLLSDNTNSALQRRAGTYAKTAKTAQQDLINRLRQKESELELKLTDLTDLAPNNTDSLRPGTGENWNPTTWVKEVQDTKVELYDIRIEIKIAEDTLNEFFNEEPNE